MSESKQINEIKYNLLLAAYMLAIGIGFCFYNKILLLSYFSSLDAFYGVIKNLSVLGTILITGLLDLLAMQIVNGFPRHYKNIIIFLRLTFPLPGCRIFSKLILKDSRISVIELTKTYGKLPELPQEQNELWYKIYKKKQSDTIVFRSNKYWLISRDVFIASLFCFPILDVVTVYNNGLNEAIGFVIFSLFIILLTWLNAYNRGTSFALDVIAR